MSALETLMVARDAAYHAMVAADDNWFDAIIRAYGEKNVSTFRYTSKGIETPELESLHSIYRNARDHYIASQDAYLKGKDWGQFA